MLWDNGLNRELREMLFNFVMFNLERVPILSTNRKIYCKVLNTNELEQHYSNSFGTVLRNTQRGDITQSP